VFRWPVLKRALKVGLSVGLLQAAISQGDLWWKGEVTAGVVAKTILSPLVTFTVVLMTGSKGGHDGA